MKNEMPHLLKPLVRADRSAHRFGVVLPISDASPQLKECLTALTAALTHAVNEGHQADLYVVIDGRNAAGAAIASTFAVHVVTADFSDLASARAVGARAALAAGVSWLAFTECHALVADRWLIEQISNEAELLIGGVEITNGFMTEVPQDERSCWRDADSTPQAVAHFGNLGMSRAAFEHACNLGGRELRLDNALLDQLTTLELATHRCDKPLVYARSQEAHAMMLPSDIGVDVGQLSPTSGLAVRLSAKPATPAALHAG